MVFRADQVQTFLPSPMATATAMYHSGKDPLRKVSRDSNAVPVVRRMRQRRLHKAFLRYHDPANWPTLRAALKRMGRADLIGNSKRDLVPSFQPASGGAGARPASPGKRFSTQHIGVDGIRRATASKPSRRAGRGSKSGTDRGKNR